MTQPFPARPKGMHFLTYMKLAMRAWRAEGQANAEVREWVDLVLARDKGHRTSKAQQAE